MENIKTKAQRIAELDDRKIRNEIDLKATEGDPIAMVAHALSRLADAHEKLVAMVDALGFNDRRQPNGPPGTTEEIAIQLKSLANSVESVATVLGDKV